MTTLGGGFLRYLKEYFAQIFVSTIELKLAFLQVRTKGLFGYSSEFRELHLSPSPKVFNTVNVIATIRKLIVSILGS